MIRILLFVMVLMSFCSGVWAVTPRQKNTTNRHLKSTLNHHLKSTFDASKKGFFRLAKRAFLRQLYTLWFENPYEYMFDRKNIRITLKLRVPRSVVYQPKFRTQRFGLFRGGTRGILFYGGLSSAWTKMFNFRYTSFDDTLIFQKVSGLPVKVKHKKSKWFQYYNPNLVRWGHRFLIPDPDDRIMGVHYLDLYQQVFFRMFRLFTESYMVLHQKLNAQQEILKYRKAVEGRNNGQSYLERTYATQLSEYYIKKGHSLLNPAHAIGFWMRRNIDHTDVELWKGLQKVMKLYDTAWFRRVRKKYQAAK